MPTLAFRSPAPPKSPKRRCIWMAACIPPSRAIRSSPPSWASSTRTSPPRIPGGGGAEGPPPRRTVAYTLLYASGLALVYASLGLLAGLTGTLFGTISSNRWAYLFMANLLLLAGLALLEVFPVAGPDRIVAGGSPVGGPPGRAG